jgi:hypothetical protein
MVSIPVMMSLSLQNDLTPSIGRVIRLMTRVGRSRYAERMRERGR